MSFDLHHHIQIKGKPESIYTAITTAAGIQQWWTTDVTIDEKVGGRAVFGFMNHTTFFEMEIERSPLDRRNVTYKTSGKPGEAGAGNFYYGAFSACPAKISLARIFHAFAAAGKPEKSWPGTGFGMHKGYIDG